MVLRRPRAGTLWGVLALAVAGFGGVRALDARGVAPPASVGGDPAAPAVVNLLYAEKDAQVAAGDYESITMHCPAARGIISGGAFHSRVNLFAAQNFPRFHGGKVPESWAMTASNVEPLVPTSANMTGYLVCAKFLQPIIPPK